MKVCFKCCRCFSFKFLCPQCPGFHHLHPLLLASTIDNFYDDLLRPFSAHPSAKSLLTDSFVFAKSIMQTPMFNRSVQLAKPFMQTPIFSRSEQLAKSLMESTDFVQRIILLRTSLFQISYLRSITIKDNQNYQH